jgi:tripartite-type tricarboxylate transporter receptor subunit TctC
MMLTLRKVAFPLLLALSSGATLAQTFPARPIRMIIGFPAGGPIDVVGRILGQRFFEGSGQSVIVDNRAGANGIIATDLVAKSAPDGYTLLNQGNHAINKNLYKDLRYDDKDFIPVCRVANGATVLVVNNDTPFKNAKELIAYAKANPGKLNYASSGNGTPGHVGFELFKTMTGTQIVHVPYKGGAAGIADLMAGQVQLMLESTNSITPHVKAGRVRGLATTGPKRAQALPELPTVAEAGVPGYEATTWSGIVAPASLPKPIIARLNTELNKVAESPTFREKAAPIGSEPAGGTPEQFRDFIRSEHAKWGDIVRRSGAKID